MATQQSIWVHGTSVEMQREGYFVSREREGHGVVFRSHGEHWFHFSIPTPVTIDGNRSRLTKILVLYRTSGATKIIRIRPYDGPEMFEKFDSLTLTGDHSRQIDASNSWRLTQPHPMVFGLGISICVDFGKPVTGSVPSLTFTAAGAEFEAS